MLEPAENEEWFVSDGGRLSGPHSAPRIMDLIRWGKVSERAYLCDRCAAWIPVRNSAFAEPFAEMHGSKVAGVRGGDQAGVSEPASRWLPLGSLVVGLTLALMLAAVFQS